MICLLIVNLLIVILTMFQINESLRTDLEYSICVITGEAKTSANRVFNRLLRTITPKGMFGVVAAVH